MSLHLKFHSNNQILFPLNPPLVLTTFNKLFKTRAILPTTTNLSQILYSKFASFGYQSSIPSFNRETTSQIGKPLTPIFGGATNPIVRDRWSIKGGRIQP